MKKLFLIITIILMVTLSFGFSTIAFAQEADTPETIEINSEEGVVIPFLNLDSDWVYRIKILKDNQVEAELRTTSYVFGFGEYVIEYHATNLLTNEERVLSKKINVVDTTAPTMETGTFRDSYTTGTRVNLGCTVKDNSGEEITAVVKVTKDGKDITASVENGYLTLLESGNYSVTFDAKDSYNNNAETIKYDFTVTGEAVSTGGLQWWIYLIIGVGAACVVAATVVTIVVIRRKKNEKK